jgi:intracellular sulfur oxidation DsrE/DsrF family protein
MQIKYLALGAILFALVSGSALADDGSDQQCPVGLISGLTLDEEFGTGSQALTRCLAQRHHVKTLIVMSQVVGVVGSSCASGLSRIYNLIADYEVTNGLRRGKDYDIVVVVYGSAYAFAVKDGTTGDGVHVVTNPCEAQVQDLMNKGIRFYLDQNSVRSWQASGYLPADVTSALVTSVDANGATLSVMYVTAAVSAVADFQGVGYQLVQY